MTSPSHAPGRCEELRVSAHQLPSWATRCAWRHQLDLRATQLERISGQLDGSKRSLDAANEERGDGDADVDRYNQMKGEIERRQEKE